MRLILLLPAVVLGLCGCGAKEEPHAPSPPVDNAATESVSADAPAMEEEIPNDPSIEEGAATAEGEQPAALEPVDYQLVRNSGLEEWSAEGPLDWTFKAGEVVKNTSAVPNEVVAQLEKREDYVVLEQVVTAARPGEQVRVTAKIRAAAPNDAILKVKYRTDTKEESQRWNYKGSGQWQGGEIMFKLPPDFQRRTMVVQVLRAPGAQAPVLVDDVSVLARRWEEKAEAGSEIN